MADPKMFELVRASAEMDEVGDILFIINHICDADILSMNGAVRDALGTLARIGTAKLDKARTNLNAASGGMLD